MKKKQIFSTLLFAAMVAVGTVSCSSGDDNGSGGNNGNDNGGNTQTETLTPNEQKVKLEKIARELVGKVEADPFSNIKDMTTALDDTDDDVISDWAKGCVDNCLESSKGDTLYNYLFVASNFTGSFELQGKKWKLANENVGYLQFKFTDHSGRECVIKVEHSGKETKVHHDSFDYHEYSWYYDYVSHTYTKHAVYTEQQTYSIPEYIKVTVAQNGTTVASTDIHTTLNIATGDVDPYRDGAEVSATTTINDYKFALEKMIYSAGKSASVQSLTVTKGGEELLSLTAQATGDITNSDNPVLKTASIMVKVLGGKARVEGNITDGQSLLRNVENADANKTNGEKYKSFLNTANSLFSVKLYFDNSSTQSAFLRLQPFERQDYLGRSTWRCKPVIVFGDGSSYSFEEYFDENTFATVIDKAQNLVDDFVRLFGK